MPFNVGENVGPYRIIVQLGQGGMATVFKAYHASLDRYVAIKALHPAFNRDPNFEGRFQREARVVAKLEHPNIVPVYDYAEHENRPYLVMKFVEGITLKARMDESPLSAEEVSKVVDAVGAALAYAHKQGVLHRDIKPSNVLLATDGQIYLADFGLARMAQSGESTLSSDMIMGTPQYISPEQAMGKPDLDQRTDLYSFGVMMYEMAVGKVPYNADTPFSIIHDHIYAPLPLPRKVNPNVTEAVERVLLKSLSKERDDRYEDAGKLVSAFKEAWTDMSAPKTDQVAPTPQAVSTVSRVENAPVSAAVSVEEKPVEPVAVQGSEKKRSPWMWVSAALAVVICIGLFAVARNNRLFARMLGGEQPQASAPVPPTQQGNPPPVQQEAPNPPSVQPGQPNPDAELHLNLAVDAWRENDLPRSMEELKQAIALAPEQNDFLLDAGTRLYDAEDYIGAAYAYLHAIANFRDNRQPLPPDVRERLEASLYFAVERDEFLDYFPPETFRDSDLALANFVQSRYALLHGNMDAAHRNLDEVLRAQPEWPLAKLLHAEVLAQDGNNADARMIANELRQAPQIPEWIKRQTDILLGKIQ